MINYLYSVLISKNQHIVLFKWLLALALIYIIFIGWRRFSRIGPNKREGFMQDGNFMLKLGDDIFDQFYAEIRDEIMNPNEIIDFELKQIVQITNPSTRSSIFLDIGSGTGNLVNELQQAGYMAYGIDKSSAMVNYSEEKHKDLEIKCGDANDSMTYEMGTFTHILCTDMTIYAFSDKMQLLKNCYFWLQPYGFLLLHLVDPKRLDKKGRSDFTDFEYSFSYEMDKAGTGVTFSETFTDKNTYKTRQHELTLHMANKDAIISMAHDCGFTSYGIVDVILPIGLREGEQIIILQRH